MKDKLLLIWKHLKPENLQKMWLQSKWIWQYGKRYWKSMVVYTLLGIAGSGVSLVSSFISKDLIDIITGHQTGKLLSTFAAMIGFSIANILFSQASTYASTFINLKVDSEIKNDIFAKMLVTDWESLTDYHTGDLVTRWTPMLRIFPAASSTGSRTWSFTFSVLSVHLPSFSTTIRPLPCLP